MTKRGPTARMRPALAGLSAYRPGKALRFKLDANESPFPFSAPLLEAMQRAAFDSPLWRYPDARATPLRNALAEHLKVDGERLLMGAGSDEVISILMGAFGEGKALYPDPSFSMYAVSSKTHGLAPLPVATNADFTLDPERLERALVAERPVLAFYARPNNPTGAVFEESILREMIEKSSETLHIIDEAYAPFFSRAQSLQHFADEYSNVAVMGTLSKIGMAALRVGWLYAPKAVAEELDKVRQPFNLSVPVIESAATFLREGQSELERFLNEAQADRDELASILAGSAHIDEVAPSEANFLLAHAPDCERLHAHLLSHEVSVRVFRHPALAGWMRISLGNAQSRNALRDALGVFPAP